jgi:hypothetical protein
LQADYVPESWRNPIGTNHEDAISEGFTRTNCGIPSPSSLYKQQDGKTGEFGEKKEKLSIV